VKRKSTDDRAALQHFFVQFLVFLWVANVNAGAKNPDGAAVRVHRPLMADGVNPSGHSPDDYQAAPQVPGQAAAPFVCHKVSAGACRRC